MTGWVVVVVLGDATRLRNPKSKSVRTATPRTAAAGRMLTRRAGGGIGARVAAGSVCTTR